MTEADDAQVVSAQADDDTGAARFGQDAWSAPDI